MRFDWEQMKSYREIAQWLREMASKFRHRIQIDKPDSN